MILDATHSNNYLDSIRNGSFKMGLGIGCELDNHYLWKSSDFDVFAGHANVGKTDWVIWYRVCLSIKHSLSWLIYSSENSVGSIKSKILEYYTGKKVKDLSNEEFNKANQWLNFKFHFVDTSKLYTARELIELFEENLELFDGVLLDPYNSLKKELGVNSHDYDYEIASEFRLFCKRNNKNLCIVAHGVTEALRKSHSKDHIYAGHPIPLSAADIEGGGKWVNRCDNFGVLHRYTQHEDEWFITQVHIRKVKETETGGSPTFIDKPIKCVKYKQSFEVNGTNPLTDKTEPREEDFLRNKAINKAREEINLEIEWKKKEENEEDLY